MVQSFKKPLKIIIEAQINPSENIDKVKTSILNLIRYVELDFLINNKMLTTSTIDEKSLYFIYEQIRARRIVAVIRKFLLKNMNQHSTFLYFNKQVAFVGSVNVCEEESQSPLGPIKLNIQSSYLKEFIDWLAPK